MSEWQHMDMDLLIQKMVGLPAYTVYIFLFFSSFFENIFPPWPGDTVTVFSGFLWAHGSISGYVLVFVILAGNLAGALTMYYVGKEFLMLLRIMARRTRRPRFLRKILRDISSAKSLRVATSLFKKHGVLYVTVSRFSAGIRFFVSIVAGLSRMNLVVFIACFEAGVVIWNSLLLAGGYMLGENWRQILDWLRIYNIAIITLIALAVLFFLFQRIRTARTIPPAA